MGDVDNGGGCACVGAEGIWEIFLSTAQFCCEPKMIFFKKKSLLKQDNLVL
jgi:hypothetical protein